MSRRWQYPEEVYLGFIAPGDSIRKQVQLVDTSVVNQELEVQGKVQVQSRSEWFDATVKPKQTGVYDVTIDAKHSGFKSGPCEGVLRVTLPNATVKDIIVRGFFE